MPRSHPRPQTRRAALVAGAVTTALLASAAPAMARVDLDPGFGGDGRVLTVPGASTNGVREVVRTPGGYVYAYGQTGDTLAGRFVRRTVVARYLHDGAPDPAWGAGGRAYGGDVLGGAPSEGGLVVGANLTATVASASTSGQVVLERFTATGQPDTGFGPGGRRAYTLADGARARVAGLVRQSTGDLVVAGNVEHGGRRLFALRVNADGSRDASFGSGELGTGTTEWHFAPNGAAVEATVQSVALDGADRIVVGGYHRGDDRNAAFLSRLSSRGAADGISAWLFRDGTGAATHSEVTDIAVDADGRIAVSGSALFGARSVTAVARLRADLSLDPAFGDAGRRLVSYGSTGSSGLAVGLGPHGWVYVGGGSWNTVAGATETRFAVARLRTDGNLDPAFDADGKIVTDFAGSANESIRSLFVSPLSGLPIAAGLASPSAFALARYADVP